MLSPPQAGGFDLDGEGLPPRPSVIGRPNVPTSRRRLLGKPWSSHTLFRNFRHGRGRVRRRGRSRRGLRVEAVADEKRVTAEEGEQEEDSSGLPSRAEIHLPVRTPPLDRHSARRFENDLALFRPGFYSGRGWIDLTRDTGMVRASAKTEAAPCRPDQPRPVRGQPKGFAFQAGWGTVPARLPRRSVAHRAADR